MIIRKAVKLRDVPLGGRYYWDDHMCFGGYVKKHLENNTTLIIDGGADGNMYNKEYESSDKIVYIDVGD